jgi:mono/diheme cytochrome c family protein
MKNRYFGTILIILLIIALAGCVSQERANPEPAPGDGEEVQEEVTVDEDPDVQEVTEEEDPVVEEIDPAAIYSARCARCHAADRSGNNGPALLPSRLTQDPSVYETIILNGKGGMPSFSNRLSAEEIGALVEFILSDPQ